MISASTVDATQDSHDKEELAFLDSRIRMKRIVLLFLALLSGLLFVLVVLLRNPVWGVAAAPAANQVVIQEAKLRQHVKALTTTEGHRHSGNLKALNQAADYIKKEWKLMGLAPTEQTFKAGGNEYKNIIATLGPAKAPRIVVGAHYDVCGNQAGADDNASGVAGLLELSRALKAIESTLKMHIELVAYTLEEPPYFRTASMGSAVHARALAKAKVDVRLMISLEMLGFFSDKPNSQQYPVSALKLLYPSVANFIAIVGNMTTKGVSVVRQLKKHMVSASTVPVYSMNGPASIPGLDFSDHLNYWAEGFPAVMVTDTSFFRNQNYHKPTDTIDTLDFKRMAQVTRGVAWAVAHFR